MIYIQLNIKNKKWKKKVKNKEVISLCKLIGKSENLHENKNYYVEIHFIDAEEICKLNKKYRNKNKSTNTLSFPMECTNFIHDILLGEMFLSYSDIEKERIECNEKFHLYLYKLITHSFLHILGYTHDEKEDSKIMIEKESQIIEKFKKMIQ